MESHRESASLANSYHDPSASPQADVKKIIRARADLAAYSRFATGLLLLLFFYA